jgi:hypothetical protein
MPKLVRQIFIELIWLTVSLGLTLLLFLFRFSSAFLNDIIDIHFHDTFFVASPFDILLPLFFLLTFVIYFVKEFPNSFRRSLQSAILIIIGFAMVLTLTLWIKKFSMFSQVNFTLYPPLSALGPSASPDFKQDPTTQLITTVLIVVQGIILASLVFVAFRWGAQKKAP